MTDLSRIDRFRIEGLRTAGRRQSFASPEQVIQAAGKYANWLAARPAKITVGFPTVAEQSNPSHRKASPTMAVTMNDGQQAVYPAPEAEDSKGFQVTDTITLTTDDPNAAVVSQSLNDDGSTTFMAVAPGAVQLTWSDGTITFVDTLNVVAGAASQIVVGAPTISDQAPAA